MKNQITTITTQHIPEIDDLLIKREADITQLAIRRAKHFAKTNQPALTGDKLESYTGDIRTVCEKTVAEIVHIAQPEKHFPQGKMDIDLAEKKAGELKEQISSLEQKNNNAQYEMNHFNPKAFQTMLLWGLVMTVLIVPGEILFNIKAFLITGENLITALVIGFSISVGAVVASHAAAFLYKEAKTKFQRRALVITVLLIMTIVFYALSLLRTAFLEKHEVHISPLYFVVFNLFFFILSAVMSFFFLPHWAEFKKIFHDLRIYNSIQRRKRRIKKLIEEKQEIEEEIVEKSKLRLGIVYGVQSACKLVNKIHRHGVETFKSTNLIYRSDRNAPECFSNTVPELDIEDILKLLNFKNNRQ